MRLWRSGAVALVAVLLSGCGAPHGGEAPWPVRPRDEVAILVQLVPSEAALFAPVLYRVDVWSETGLEPVCAPKVPEGFAGGASAPMVTRQPLHGGTWMRITQDLRPRRIGTLRVPPVEARAKAANGREIVARTSETSFECRALLPEEKGSVEAPAEAFSPVPWWRANAVALLAGTALLAAGVLAWRRFARRATRTTREVAETALPPHTKALRALARLRNEPRISTEQVERFHVELARVLRVYVEERFGLHAPERTTEEFFAEARRLPALDATQVAELTEFLRHCDLVKFARYVPGDAEPMRVFGVAERFVETTRADRTVPTATAHPAPALTGEAAP